MEDMLTLEEKCRGNDHQMLSDRVYRFCPHSLCFGLCWLGFFFTKKTLQKQKTQIHQEIEMPVIDL